MTDKNPLRFHDKIIKDNTKYKIQEVVVEFYLFWTK